VAEQKPSTAIEAVESGLAAQGYIASRQIATAVYLSQQIEKPILVEGPAGVGKTELAKAIAAWRGLKMIRLQCYEGLDEAKALYEWKYAKQLLYTQILKDKLGEVLAARRLCTLHLISSTISATCSSPRSSSSRGRCCKRWSSRAAACS